jgi:hypothetical protein
MVVRGDPVADDTTGLLSRVKAMAMPAFSTPRLASWTQAWTSEGND